MGAIVTWVPSSDGIGFDDDVRPMIATIVATNEPDVRCSFL